MNISTISSKIILWLNSINPKSVDETAVIKYGMELFLGNASKLLIISFAGLLIGKGGETLVILFTFCMFRLQAGGRHVKSNIGCTLCMTGIWGISLTANHYITFSLPILGFIFAFCTVEIILWVPQSINIEYFSRKDIIKKKLYSFTFLFCILLISALFPDLRGLIVSPVILEAITLLPKHKEKEVQNDERKNC